MKYSKIHTLVFLVTGFPPDVSGVSHFNWERVRWFAQQSEYRVVVFAPDWQNVTKTDLKYSDLNNLTIEYYPSKPWLPYKLTHVPKFDAAGLINQKIVNYQPDLIIVTDVERFFFLGTWKIPGLNYARENHIPSIAEYHTDFYNFWAAYPGWQWLRQLVGKTKLTSHLYRNQYHKFNVTLCSSAAGQSCREMGLSNVKNISFLGIDVSSYSPKLSDRECLKTWLSTEEQDHKVILFLGRLAFEKRIDLLIKAFIRLKHQDPKLSLIIAGDGPVDAVNQAKQLARQVSHVHFTGFLLGEIKAKVLASCDVFCSPSPYETFGRTTVEAMASGIPLVTVDSGAVSNYIKDEVNGYLVESNDVEALASCLDKVLLSDNGKITQRALQDVKQFSIEQGCQNLHHYYQKILNRSMNKKANENSMFLIAK